MSLCFTFFVHMCIVAVLLPHSLCSHKVGLLSDQTWQSGSKETSEVCLNSGEGVYPCRERHKALQENSLGAAPFVLAIQLQHIGSIPLLAPRSSPLCTTEKCPTVPPRGHKVNCFPPTSLIQGCCSFVPAVGWK